MQALAVLILLSSTLSAPRVEYHSITRENRIIPGVDPKAAASIKLQDRKHEFGYTYIVIKTNPDIPDYEQAYAAGYLEGYTMGAEIYHLMNNVLEDSFEGAFPVEFYNYARKNLAYIDQQVSINTSAFWHAVNLTAGNWLKGLTNGYTKYANEQKIRPYTIEEFFMYNSVGDWEDLEAILIVEPESREKMLQRRRERIDLGQHHHCSAAVRMAPDLSDVFFSHDTWTSFGTGFNRAMKHYHFHWDLGESQHQKISFSSMPGYFSSIDDFYIQSVTSASGRKSNIATLETTYHTFNTSLYDEFLRTDGSAVLTWMRSQIANMMSFSADQWAEVFNNENSYTYNNMWVSLDYGLFSLLSAGMINLTVEEKKDHLLRYDKPLLYINEVVPGHIKAYDVTHMLVNDGYFFSINTPMDEELFVISGYAAKNDPYWSFNESSRYKIFTRELPKVDNFEDFKLLMRYNDYMNDEASNKDPGQSIASRYDLRDPSLCGRSPSIFGCTDSKATDLKLATQLAFDVVIGPTRGRDGVLPLFNFSQHPGIPRHGVPDTLPDRWSIYLPTFVENILDNEWE